MWTLQDTRTGDRKTMQKTANHRKFVKTNHKFPMQNI